MPETLWHYATCKKSAHALSQQLNTAPIDFWDVNLQNNTFHLSWENLNSGRWKWVRMLASVGTGISFQIQISYMQLSNVNFKIKFADIQTADSEEEPDAAVMCAIFTWPLCWLAGSQQKLIFTKEESNFPLIKILMTLKLRTFLFISFLPQVFVTQKMCSNPACFKYPVYSIQYNCYEKLNKQNKLNSTLLQNLIPVSYRNTITIILQRGGKHLEKELQIIQGISQILKCSSGPVTPQSDKGS